jgi:hypothetical protein
MSVQFKVSPEMVTLHYKDGNMASSDRLSGSSEKPSSSSSSESGEKASSPSAEKIDHEAKRTVLFSEMEEYRAKLGLIGVTVKEYGPAVMRLLGFLLNRRDKNKTRNAKQPISAADSHSSGKTTSEKIASKQESTPVTPEKEKEKEKEKEQSNQSKQSNQSSKSTVNVSEEGKLKRKKLSTRKFQSLFSEKNLKNQSNEKQQRDAIILYSLFKKLNIAQNCIDGTKLKADIKENENKPSRYIFLFFKTIDHKQYVVGFVSGTKVESQTSSKSGSPREQTAVIDYVCPRLDPPPNETTKWRNTENSNNLVAYCILKLLWLNNDKGQKKYTSVHYKSVDYKTSKDVSDRLDKIEIDSYARQTMGFKRRLGGPLSALGTVVVE